MEVRTRARRSFVTATAVLALACGHLAVGAFAEAAEAVPAPQSAPAASASSTITDGLEVANKGAIAAVDLGGTWDFKPLEPAADATTIQVPGGGWVKQGFRNTSIAEYSRSITVPDTGQPQTVMLELGVVNHEATVKVDGKTVGTQTTSYTPSNFDLTAYVQPGSTHTISITVKGREALKLGDKYLVAEGAEWSNTVPQGIYRSAFLRVYPQTYVASTFVQTSVQNKTISYDVELRNTGSEAKTVTVDGSLSSASGKSFTYPTVPTKSVQVPANGTVTTTVGPLPWTAGDDSYWWPNVPYKAGYRAQLHTLTVELNKNTNASQISSTRFGFKEFTQPPNQGKYFLNGVAINLRGDNIQVADYDRIDANGVSDSVDHLPGFLPPANGNAGWPGAVDNYQRLNFNVVRLHQSPVSPYMIDVLDEMGMMAIGESAIRGSANREDFKAGRDNMVNHVRDLVLQNRNHPSIIEWSQSNETDQAETDSEQFEKDLFNSIRKVDPTRPIIADGPNPERDYPTMTPENGYTQFNTFDHYIDGFGNYGTALRGDITKRPIGETEYIWPATSLKSGFTWFSTATVGKRGKGAADLRPYTLLSGWAGFVPGTKSTDFITEENRYPIYGDDNLAKPWENPQIQLMQKAFNPYLAADLDFWDQNGRSNFKGEYPVRARSKPIGYGQDISRDITVFNDGLKGDKVDLEWQVHDGTTNGPVIADGKTTLTIPVGEFRSVPVEFTSPSVGDGVVLSLKTSVGGVEQFSDNSQFMPLGSEFSFDDATIGNADRQFAYTGNGWQHGQGDRGSYLGTESLSSGKDDSATGTFSGYLGTYFAATGPDRGIVAVSVDGGPETMIDLYSPVVKTDQELWTSPVLSTGEHKLKIRVTGDKNSASSGVKGAVDRVDAPTSLTTTVVGVGSKRCLDVYGKNQNDGATVDIYDCDRGANQEWTLDPTGQLVGSDSGKCLDIARASRDNGAAVQQWTCNGQGNQKWGYDSQMRLVNPASGKCLNVYGGATGNQSRLVIWTCDDTSQNKWVLSAPVKPVVPGAPQKLTAIARDGSATMTWAAPESDGGAAIIKYAVTSVPASRGCETSTGWSTYTCVATGLENGKAYTFTVTAQNSVGVGAASDPVGPIIPQAPVDPNTPVISATTTPQANAAGWSKDPVKVAASASTASGVAVTLAYKVDEGAFADSTDGVTVSSEGSHVVTVRGTSSTGAVATVEVPVKIDLTKPESTVQTDPSSGNASAGGTATARFTATDAGSGVSYTEYSVDGGATWTRATDEGVSFTAPGQYRVQYRSVDVAGNVGDVQEVSLSVAPGSTVPNPGGGAGATSNPGLGGGSNHSPSPSGGTANLARTGTDGANAAVLVGALTMLLLGGAALAVHAVRKRRSL